MYILYINLDKILTFPTMSPTARSCSVGSIASPTQVILACYRLARVFYSL